MINNVFVRKIDLSDALLSLYPSAVWKVINDPSDYKNVIWEDEDIAKPSESVLRSEMMRLQVIQDSELYRFRREPEYPPLSDFADAYYWAQKGDNTKMNEYVTKCDAVKEKFPKGE